MIYSVGTNSDGFTNYKVCTESSNSTRTDPVTGDGPECDKYEDRVTKESAFDAAIRGLSNGLVPALFGGIIGLYIYDVLSRQFSKRARRE